MDFTVKFLPGDRFKQLPVDDVGRRLIPALEALEKEGKIPNAFVGILISNETLTKQQFLTIGKANPEIVAESRRRAGALCRKLKEENSDWTFDLQSDDLDLGCIRLTPSTTLLRAGDVPRVISVHGAGNPFANQALALYLAVSSNLESFGQAEYISTKCNNRLFLQAVRATGL